MAAAAAPPTIAQPLGVSLDATVRSSWLLDLGLEDLFWMASTSLVRLCEARSIASEAFSTAVIAWVGSVS